MILNLDFGSSTPIYKQIRDQVVIAIADGTLTAGEHLPTIRALAEESGINMMTVSKAYQLLKNEGYIMADRRSGAVVLGRDGESGVDSGTTEKLKLCMSELHLAGLSKDKVIKLCEKLYEEVTS